MDTEITIGEERILKLCKKCGRIIPLTFFNKNKYSPDGRRSTCRNCDKQYRKDNADMIAKQKHKVYIENRDIILAQRKEYYNNNADIIKDRMRKYYIQNSNTIIERVLDYAKTPEGKVTARRKYSKRKGFGESEPLNEWFEGSHEHHLHIYDTTTTIFIPAELHNYMYHNSATGQGILEMAIISLLYLSGEHARLKDGNQ